MQRLTEGKAVKAVLIPTLVYLTSQNFQELTNTGQPACACSEALFEMVFSLYLKEKKKINVSFFYHNTHHLLIVYFQMMLYSLSLGNRTSRDLSIIKITSEE